MVHMIQGSNLIVYGMRMEWDGEVGNFCEQIYEHS